MSEAKCVKEIVSEIQVILKDDNAKVMSRVGSNIARRWIKDKEFDSPEQLLKSLKDYLISDLGAIGKIDLEFNNGSATLHIAECKPCCGSLVKEKGGTPACPFSQIAVTAMNKAFRGSKIVLEGITKTPDENGNPIVGICHQKINYDLSDKSH